MRVQPMPDPVACKMTDVVVLPGMSDDSRDSPEAKTLYVVVERDSVRPADITCRWEIRRFALKNPAWRVRRGDCLIGGVDRLHTAVTVLAKCRQHIRQPDEVRRPRQW